MNRCCMNKKAVWTRKMHNDVRCRQDWKEQQMRQFESSTDAIARYKYFKLKGCAFTCKHTICNSDWKSCKTRQWWQIMAFFRLSNFECKLMSTTLGHQSYLSPGQRSRVSKFKLYFDVNRMYFALYTSLDWTNLKCIGIQERLLIVMQLVTSVISCYNMSVPVWCFQLDHSSFETSE